jgi:hypothetical protein
MGLFQRLFGKKPVKQTVVKDRSNLDNYVHTLHLQSMRLRAGDELNTLYKAKIFLWSQLTATGRIKLDNMIAQAVKKQQSANNDLEAFTARHP